jgi:cytosine/adenosine deaminase-related metal-dependent hydrolase
MQADLAIYELSDPRYFGVHDRASAPIIGAGAPRLRRLIRGGRTLVEDGAPVGFDVAKLRADAAKVVARLAG